MKSAHCDHCGHLVFFENTHCMSCEHQLAYLPDLGQIASLEPAANGLFRTALPGSAPDGYRLCANFAEQQVCNWTVAASDPNPLCVSCRLTRVIPDLTVPGHREGWYRLESAKRRLIYTLKNLRLPVAPRSEDPERGLVFDFLADPDPAGPPILTGHNEGVITINLAETDDAERERRRHEMREPYRTLLGHFRHEVGHYYWDRLIRDSEALEPFRAAFGDERLDYAEAVRAHYDQGPPADWQERFVSAYATTHPWEDWAETWAHYLHVTDTLETAAACGISIRPPRPNEPVIGRMPDQAGSPFASFDELIASWFPLTYILNNLNRSLGLPDSYPFVLSAPALEKMRFVHNIIRATAIQAGVRPTIEAPQAGPALVN